MTYEQYFDALNELHIENPTVKSIKDIFPHLHEKELDRVLGLLKEGFYSYVAVPSLKVKGMVQIVLFEPESYDQSTGEFQPNSLDWCGATSAERKEYLFFNEALEYARKNWGEQLVDPDWKECFHFHFHDPTKLDIQGHSSCVKDVYFTANKNLEDLLSDVSKPTSQILNDSIVEITDNDLIFAELKNTLRRNEFLICAMDGSGLTYEACETCGCEYYDDPYREIWDLPLPKKIEDFLVAQGHNFQINPEHARNREEKLFQHYLFQRKIDVAGKTFERAMKDAYKKYGLRKK